MMPNRTRSMSLGRMSGKAQFNWEGPYDPTLQFLNIGSQTISDHTGLGGDVQPLQIDRLVDSGGFINREPGGTSTDNWFHQYICQWMRSSGNGGHLAVSGVPSSALRCTNAVARTNPSRPYVDVPASALDFGGGIRRLRDAGNSLRNIIRQSGGSYLRYQFGIRPLVQDTIKLALISQQINNRVEEINRLYGGRGLRRTVGHGSWSSSAFNQSLLIQSTYDTINSSVMTMTTVTCRTHVRWKPASPSGVRPTTEQVRRWAVRATHGFTIDFSTLWELTPWSWLIDWGLNVGEVLKTTRNMVNQQLVGVYPMTHTKTTVELSPATRVIRGRPTVFSGGRRVRETKSRSIGAVSITAQQPFLTGGQLGILAALGASRR